MVGVEGEVVTCTNWVNICSLLPHCLLKTQHCSTKKAGSYVMPARAGRLIDKLKVCLIEAPQTAQRVQVITVLA